MIYITIALSFAIAGGVVGRLKGSSFWIWFLISGLFPVIGLAAAVLYRWETEEPQRHCPQCAHVCMAYDALCTKCGEELEYPSDEELIVPVRPA